MVVMVVRVVMFVVVSPWPIISEVRVTEPQGMVN